MTEKDIVLNFWNVMASNDFYAAAECLSPDCEVIWPFWEMVHPVRSLQWFQNVFRSYIPYR